MATTNRSLGKLGYATAQHDDTDGNVQTSLNDCMRDSGTGEARMSWFIANNYYPSGAPLRYQHSFNYFYDINADIDDGMNWDDDSDPFYVCGGGGSIDWLSFNTQASTRIMINSRNHDSSRHKNGGSHHDSDYGHSGYGVYRFDISWSLGSDWKFRYTHHDGFNLNASGYNVQKTVDVDVDG